MSLDQIPTGTVTFTVSGGPTLTGTLGGGGQVSVSTSVLTAGAHTVTATYGGDATFASSSSAPLVQNVGKASTTTTLTATPGPSGFSSPLGGPFDALPSAAAIPAAPLAVVVSQATTTALTASPNPSVFGQIVTFTATVAAVKSPTTTVLSPPGPVTCCRPVTLTATVTRTSPTACPLEGTVTFVISSDGPALVAPVDAAGHATATVASLSMGSHSVITFYSGDNCYTSSLAPPVMVTVTKSPSVTTITTTPSSCCQPTTVTVHVAPIAPVTCTPTGTVTITVDGTPTTAPLVAGAATITTGTLTAAAHTVSATYNGDTCFDTSTATSTHTVTKAASKTTLTSTPNPSNAGQPVTITATVAGTTPSSCTPTGTVVVIVTADGPPQTVPLDAGGHAVATVSSLSIGSHGIVALYGGDACFANSSAPTTTQVVH
jgi:hypothetical protein